MAAHVADEEKGSLPQPEAVPRERSAGRIQERGVGCLAGIHPSSSDPARRALLAYLRALSSRDACPLAGRGNAATLDTLETLPRCSRCRQSSVIHEPDTLAPWRA